MTLDQRSRQRVPWQAKFGSLAIIWGASFLFMKIGLRWFSPVQIATFRILLGAVTVVVLLHLVGGRLPRSWVVWRHLLVVAVFLASLPFVLFPLGEERVSSALAGIGNAITPIATVLATMAMVPAERLPGRRIAAVVVGFLGVGLIAQPWDSVGQPDLVGFGLTLVAGASYGIGWTYVRKYLAHTDLGGLQLPAALLTVASGQMLVVLGVWWALHRDRFPAPWAPAVDAVGPGAGPILSVLALGVLGTGLAYLFQFDVFRAVGQQVGSLVTYLIPVVSVALGYLFLGERLGPWQLAGAALVLGAAVVVTRPTRQPRVIEREPAQRHTA
ncbi:DMT family transporter [Intrasporangium calvum]|uniref:DMT family transporter n=1 Tax=Intrasporangium calvum TaxID=53358 RepID=A0ABT5GMM1_9MICO|nr:DMT family transporter [Intrasporangium calvum]MDC5698911.1 DMT family transporter [Intrasporangium calvum]